MDKIVVASDSFKGSATSLEVAEAVEKGIRRKNPSVEVVKLPIADGGEGTVEALIQALDGKKEEIEVTGPYDRPVKATYGFLDESKAVIEMAEASGLHYKKEEDSIWDATTYGTGELILDAIEKGAKEIFLGVGGSATNDGGAGMAQALGVQLSTEKGALSFGAKDLGNLTHVDNSTRDERLEAVDITILSDVTNPLVGEKGASVIFGPQKGAEKDDVEKLDHALTHFKEVVEKEIGRSVAEQKGAGAAGGLGFGLMAFCEAKSSSGIEKIIELIGLREAIKEADLVITGEGQMDGQSIGGKAPIGVAKVAKEEHKPVAAIVGSADEDFSKIYEAGIDLVIETVHKPMELKEAIEKAPQLIARAAEKVMYAYELGRGN